MHSNDQPQPLDNLRTTREHSKQRHSTRNLLQHRISTKPHQDWSKSSEVMMFLVIIHHHNNGGRNKSEPSCNSDTASHIRRCGKNVKGAYGYGTYGAP